MKSLLKVKKNLARRRPKFIRQDAHKKIKVGVRWRRPRGLHSKMRLQKKGYRGILKVGFRSPRKVRNMTQKGLNIKLISNPSELSNVTPNDGLIISKRIGLKKKLAILEYALKKQINVLNIKDIKSYIDNQKSVLDKKRKQKTEKKVEREKRKEKKKKTIEEKVKEKKTDEEKKAEEKKELDKVLTKKGSE